MPTRSDSETLIEMKSPTIRQGTIVKQSDNLCTVQLANTCTFISVSCHSLTFANGSLPNASQQCSVALGPFCFTTNAFIHCTLVAPPIENWTIQMGDTSWATPGQPGARKPYPNKKNIRTPYNPPNKNRGISDTDKNPAVAPGRTYYGKKQSI